MRSPRLWLALTFTLVGAAACSVNPLQPDGKGGAGGAAGQGGGGGTSAAGGTMGNGGTGGLDCGPAIPLPACPIGRTIVDCVVDSTGQPHWAVSCPDLTGDGGVSGTSGGGAGGAGGAGGVGGSGGASPCTSTTSCANGEVCTTEDGARNAAPGCTGAGVSCPAVCYGTCRPAADGPVCGTTRCAAGKTCCNSSCGICTGPNEGCTKQICQPPATGGACVTDADCRVQADYCTGCDCRALAKGQSLPPCSGPGVRCLRDPCDGARAACANGICTVAIP